MKERLTTQEAADVLGVTAGRIRQMVLDGALKADKFGSNLAIDAESVEAAKRRKTKPGPVAAVPAEALEAEPQPVHQIVPKKKGKKQ